MKNNIKIFIAIVLFAVMSIIALISWMYPSGKYYNTTDNDLIKRLKENITTYSENFPEDKVYLFTDKPFYAPGETVWFSVFVRDGKTLQASSKSEIVYVELINPKGGVAKKLSLIARDGIAKGDVSFSDEEAGGIYKIKAYTNWQKNEGSVFGFSKEIQVQDVVLPNLKMKIDFLKKAYGKGDEVALKFEVQTNENKPLHSHKIKYVVNIGGKQLLEENTITSSEGSKVIKFKLPDNLKTNDGIINVLMEYQGSTESISRSVPIVLNNIDLKFFPEGGDLVNGLATRVGFKSLNENGKPADIEGVVVDENNTVVSSFNTYHQGMGAFDIKPLSGKKYTAKITRPEGITKTYDLPVALDKGYVLNVVNTKNELALKIKSSENEMLSVVAQVRGKIYWSTAYNAIAGENYINLPSYVFPMGVAQFTLFDSKGIARCERLVFVNKQSQLNISITTDKEKYLPREKVKMKIAVTDNRGIPMPGQFSLSVVSDNLISFADDKQGDLLTSLLLESDIHEKIEDPKFYFNSKELKADQGLDYVMMTSGWRRFSWEKVIKKEIPVVAYPGEKAKLSGIVMNAYTGKPIANAKVKLNSTGNTYQADDNGKFIFNKLDLYQPESITLTANGYYDNQQTIYRYGENTVYYLYEKNYKHKYYDVEATRMEDIPMAGAPNADMMVLEKEGKKDRAPKPIQNKFKIAPSKAPVPDVEKKPKQENKDKKVLAMQEKKKGFVGNKNGDGLDDLFMNEEDNNEPFNANVTYYRARQFPVSDYSKTEPNGNRTDFRTTLFFDGVMETDKNGKKEIEFFTSDDITSFRVTVEGIATDGMPGKSEKVFYTQLPVAMNIKVPGELIEGDVIDIPLTITNNTNQTVKGLLNVNAPDVLSPLGNYDSLPVLYPNKSQTQYLKYRVAKANSEGEYKVTLAACGLSDGFSKNIKTVAKGFPASQSISGNDLNSKHHFLIDHLVKGSLKIKFTAFPSVVSDLLTGVEGILREPYGCFEQTSMSSYPNIMAVDYMKTNNKEDDKLYAYAGSLIDKGYKRLTSFETKDKGYEWFGSSPGHEALSAYGLMQFNDMKQVYDGVDQKMIDRTAEWLMSRKDGNGGFKRNSRALDNFGRASDEITNAYIVYALTEAGYTDIKKEMDKVYKIADGSNDPYLIALAANALYNLKDNRSEKLTDQLLKLQNESGAYNGAKHSITYSTGKSLEIETSSLALMALMKQSNKNYTAINNTVSFIVKQRSGFGMFGNTQGTVLALKALTEFAKQSKKTASDGTIELYSGNKKIKEINYVSGQQGAIVADSLENYFDEGNNEIRVKFKGTKEGLPYSVAIEYNTTLPKSSEECSIAIKTKLAVKSATVGETVRLNVQLSNTTKNGLPSSMAVIGLPAGLSAQPWQLKELQEKKVFDYYEIIGNKLALYYRGMAPEETKEINLDLKAEIPGTYEAPASSSYLYYTNEHKCWTATDKIVIK